MTRPSLLHLLAHPAALTGADVRELEQLAQAFPYCQAAHLLLAKAAHDQGSMLAGQRLRRAATYATDRARLRYLIELVPVVPLAVTSQVAEPIFIAAAADDLSAIQDTETTEAATTTPSAPNSAEAGALLVEVEETVLPEPLAQEPVGEAELVDELPAQAPPIRPPAEAAAAHLEFGLADAEPAEIMAYRLPELVEPALDLSAPLPPVPAYAGVADVGYAPGEGSRLGYCLQSPSQEYSLAFGPAALVPSATLPPAGEFFAPDALLVAYLAAHQVPAAIALPAAQDLINSFLSRKPQATPRRRTLPPPPDAEDEEQPDLAGASTRAVPDLASENLAKILVRQGKPDRAIAIYERLMVKQPEKMAYFAAQIDSLRPPA
jgi:tetratricopeptide (TPR) repeat protein